MKIEEVMSREVKTCRANDSLVRAAQLMWEHDIGCVPVVDDGAAAIGMITDRDICMAAYTQGRRLDEITVGSVMSTGVKVCDPSDTLESVAASMKRHQVRRLPVLANQRVVGFVSLSDLSRVAEREPDARMRDRYIQHVETTLAAVGRPRAANVRA
jgi:CBS domain-containing protein